MIYKRKKNKVIIVFVTIITIVMVLLIFRLDIKAYILGDKLKVLSSKESVFFVEDKIDNISNIEKLSTLDENRGIMIFTIDNSSVDIEKISQKFSGESIVARIKRDVESFDGYTSDKKLISNFAKDTKVELLSHYDSSWYYVKDLESDDTSWVSEDMLSFPYTPRTKKDILTDEEIEVYINYQDIKSASDQMLYVDIMRQSIYVFKNYSQKWDLVRRIDCMTGTSRNPILKGEFKIVKKDDYLLYNSEKISYKYLSKISNAFDIRSIGIPISKSQDTSNKEEDKITRSLKGNISLSESDAKWIYENIDLNTSIIIK